MGKTVPQGWRPGENKMFERHRIKSRAQAWAISALVACGLIFASAAAWAMRVSPMVAEMTTTGAGSAARIEVGNVGSAAMPFETQITRMDVDANGEVVETPADEEFLVFPPQGVVGVGGRQVMRVQWVGAPDIDRSQAYYLAVKQLPIPTDGKPPESGGEVAVTVLYTMKALLVVAPPGAEPKIEVVSAKPIRVTAPATEAAAVAEGAPIPTEPGLEIVVANTGKRYALMAGATWIIEGTAKDGTPYRQELKTADLSAIVGVGFVPPVTGRRTFKIPTGGIELDPAKPIVVRFGR